MIARISPPTLDNTIIQLPVSKSVSNRELVLHYMMGTVPPVAAFSEAEDTVALHLIFSMDETEWNAGLGGTTIRFALAALCAAGKKGILTGEGPLLKRPIGPLVDALRQLGYDIEYLDEEGYPPLKLNGGEVTSKRVDINPAVSSQFVSAMLLIGSFLPAGLELHYTSDPVSQPYVDLTLSVIRSFGGEVKRTRDGYEVLPADLEASRVSSDRDWSAAAFWYAMAGMREGSSLVFPDLSMESSQGDMITHYIFNRLGVHTHRTDEGVKVIYEGKVVEQFDHDFSACPDLAQAVAVCCACKGVPATLRGLATLRHKETDRIDALESELTKLGIHVETGPDWLELKGEVNYNGETINTYHDHRMAMAFAIASFAVEGLKIDDPEVVIKSYPTFWAEFAKAGGVQELLM